MVQKQETVCKDKTYAWCDTGYRQGLGLSDAESNRENQFFMTVTQCILTELVCDSHPPEEVNLFQLTTEWHLVSNSHEIFRSSDKELINDPMAGGLLKTLVLHLSFHKKNQSLPSLTCVTAWLLTWKPSILQCLSLNRCLWEGCIDILSRKV